MAEDPLEPRQCTARSKRSGERCKRAPIIGGTVCAMHGGKAPAVAAAAESRVQSEKAEQELRRLWVGLQDADPVQDPVASMARLAGALETMLDQVGEVVNTVKTTAAGANLSQVRGEIVLLERIASLLGRTLDSMARLGIAERHVELQAEQAAVVTSAFRMVMGLQVMAALLPADRDLVLRTFLSGLGVQVEAIAGGAA